MRSRSIFVPICAMLISGCGAASKNENSGAADRDPTEKPSGESDSSSGQNLPKIQVTALLVSDALGGSCEITTKFENLGSSLVKDVFYKATSVDSQERTTGSTNGMVTNLMAGGSQTDKINFISVPCSSVSKITNFTINGNADTPIDPVANISDKSVIPIKAG